MPASSRTVVAVFETSAAAEKAIADLVSNGFSRDNIHVTSNDTFASHSASGNAGLSGQQPHDASGGGIGGFFRRLFGTDDQDVRHYDEAIRRGAIVVSVDTDDDDRAADILDRNGAIDVDDTAASTRSDLHNTSARVQADRDDGRDLHGTGDRSIPVVREELHVGKRTVPRGGVRVFNRVVEQPVEEQVKLREERLRVDRRPADRPATEADFRTQDQVIEVTEMAEEPVVGKTARVVEEVVIGKQTTERTETIRDTVRRTDVNVEKMSGADRARSNYDDDFRQDFRTRYGSVRGAKYENYAPAYEYGSRVASDERYRGRSWDEVEPMLRTDYERQYQGGKWEQIKDSVRYGWDKVTGRR
jgi:uncharacterized protein (TIGR02271 family)